MTLSSRQALNSDYVERWKKWKRTLSSPNGCLQCLCHMPPRCSLLIPSSKHAQDNASSLHFFLPAGGGGGAASTSSPSAGVYRGS